MASDYDAAKAAQIAREYAISLHGGLALYSFKVLSVQPNSVENLWYVDCEFLPTAKDIKPSQYRIKVNTQNGQIAQVEPLAQG